MTTILSEWLRNVPENLFWKEGRVGGDSDYPSIQAYFMRQFYSGKSIDEYTADILAKKVPSLSTFQRGISKEAESRRRSYNSIAS